MKKLLSIFLITFLLVCLGEVFGQQPRYIANVIWNYDYKGGSNKLNYDTAFLIAYADFTGFPQTYNLKAAEISTGFGYNLQSSGIDGVYNVSITLYCIMDKNKSWIKRAFKNEYTLNHEQRHFDISFYIARLFYEALQNMPYKATYATDIQVLYKQYLKKLSDFQNAYDAETQHGIDKAKQEVWNQKIDALLETVKQ